MITRFIVGMALAGACAALPAQTIKAVTEASSYTFPKNGKVGGPASQIVETTLQRAGLTDYSIALYPWARAYDLALQQPNVLIYLIARTPAREAQFKWAGEFLHIEYHLYKLRDRKDIVVRNLQEARAYTVGVMRDDVRHEYLRSQGFNKLVVSAQNIDNFKKLINGQVQLVPMPERDAALLCEEAHVDCASLEKVYTLDALSSGIYMAYSKATPDDIVARTRAAFDRLKADGTVARLMNAKR
ncbi:MAG TPA: transporter substrate-binding domain-containing protein [Rhizobacter sp.]|nr:transporter substrate-binding domain-containing protein [Rhizobacter sp.]